MTASMNRFAIPLARWGRPARGWLAAVLLGCGLGWGSSLTAAVQPPVSKEFQVKAAFLYNFTKFVEWPSIRFDDVAAPIVIGVLGDDPFSDELEKIVRDRKVNGRGITILRLTDAPDPRLVHALFVPAGEESLVEKQIDELIQGGVLVVGDSKRFFALGGVITFTTEDDKVRFTINMAAAEQARLKISAQLQKLATVVRH